MLITENDLANLQKRWDTTRNKFYPRDFVISNKEMNYKVWPEFESSTLKNYFENDTKRILVRNLYITKDTIFDKIKKLFSKKNHAPYIYNIIEFSSVIDIDGYFNLTLNRPICFYTNIDLVSEDESIIFELPYVYYSPSIVDRKSEYNSGLLTKGSIETLSEKVRFKLEHKK